MPIERIAWTAAEAALWARIEAHPFEPAAHSLTFVERLARDHGWSLDAARTAVEEYRRFAFLAMTAGAPMTPSEEVDEVWHLHLTFSRDYWDIWCPMVLGAPLHHDPTTGSRPDARRFADQYARTLARYEACFGPPHPALWPGVADRFARGPRFRTVDRDRTLVVPLPGRLGRRARRLRDACGLAALVSLLTGGPARASLNVLDWPGPSFLELYSVLAVMAIGAALAVAEVMRRGGASRPIGDLSPMALAYLAGGPARAADVAALGLIEAGVLVGDPDGRLAATTEPATVDAAHRAIHRQAAMEPLRRTQLAETLADSLDPVRDRLVRDGLILSRETMDRLRTATVCLIGPVVLLGIAKIMVGLSRNKPVGFLIALTVATSLAGILIADRKRLATTAGRGALAAYKEDHARSLRAPLPDEVLMAFALTGATALAGTAFSGYAPFFAPRSGDSDGGSGGDAGAGCGGGGGGGGGCGGCGGGH